MLPHLGVEERTVLSEYPVLLTPALSSLLRGCLSSVAQVLRLFWILGASPAMSGS